MKYLKRKLSALLIFCSVVLSAQNIELSPFVGYMVNGNLKTYYDNYTVDNSASYGAMLSVKTTETTFAELTYIRSDSYFRYTGLSVSPKSIPISVEYYHIGTVKQLPVSELVMPFAAISLGATRFHPKEGYDWDGDGISTTLNDGWRFSATLAAGVKIALNQRIALRTQARLLLPMEFDGLFLGIGSGGVSSGASFRVPLLSADFTGGIVIRLGS